MATINVYERYYEADLVANGVQRNGALVMLVSDSECGNIRYEAAVTFFPHKSEDDFAVSYDAYYSEILFEAKGRRSKKREESLLAELEQHINALAEKAGGQVLWDRPIGEERRG
ncbi:MAG: hypothetical protein J5767_11670 [Paludibacteraceae bacterium]|nr:hypothetical protein [Paludibacteraceae bacterium]